MKNIKLGLLPKVIIAIALGVVGGFILPEWTVRIFVTTNSLISNFIGMFIPILILGLVSSGIADLGKGAGSMLLVTVTIAYFSTVLSGAFSFVVGKLTFNGMVHAGSMATNGTETLIPYFEVKMPAFIDVTTALILSFIFGITASRIQDGTLKKLIDNLKDVVTLVIAKVIVPLLPLYIFGIFLVMASQGSVGPQMVLLAELVGIIFAMHITILICQFAIAGAICHRNPFKALVTMLPAYLTALGTASSAATIPVTLGQTKKNGVNDSVADFVIPLCATIHMPCSLMKIVACAFALMLSMGLPIDNMSFMHFIFMAAITLVAAPGVPGGCIMAALGPLAAILGFTEEMQGMMIALYILMDSFGTAGNVTGDGAIALVIDKLFTKK